MKKRIDRCIDKIKREGLDSLLLSCPTNITYLSGFRSAEGFLLITGEGELTYFTNFLYQKEASQISFWKLIISNGNIFFLIGKEIKKKRLIRVGFEGKHLPFSEYKEIKRYIPGVNFLATKDFIEDIRAIKDKEEILAIKKSIKISKEAFQFIEEIWDESMTEKDLSLEIEKFLKLKGDNQLPFLPIVASGKNSAFPHYLPAKKKLDSNFFLIDLGSKYYGYCADLTRMFFWDKMPSLFKKIYDTVKKAQDLSIRKIKDGVKIKEVDKAAREVIEKKGWSKYFGHGVGHGIGLEVHELPFLNYKNDGVLQEGMVITIEPAVYIKGKLGIRLEDMVLVRKNKGEVLSGNFHK